MLPDMLEEYVKQIVPSAYDRAEASSRRDVAQAVLKASLLKSELMFESGSWSHGTAMAGKSDVDYMAWALGARPQLPSSALTSAKNALIGSDWRLTAVTTSSPIVSLKYYTAPHFEIVPAWWQGTSGNHNVFHIPGRRDEWVLSCPDAHLAYVSRQNDRLGKKVKPLIRLLKAWKLHVGAPVSSFYLEMRTAQYAAGESAIFYYMDLPAVVRSIIAIGARDMNDPEGIVGRIPGSASDEKQARTLRLLREAESNLDRAAAAMVRDDRSAYWSAMYDVFGSAFPYPP